LFGRKKCETAAVTLFSRPPIDRGRAIAEATGTSAIRRNEGQVWTSATQRPIGVNARDRFIQEAVLQQGDLASQFASFLNRHPPNISRALQKT